MKIKTVESVTESEVRITLAAETAEEMAQLRDFAAYPRLSGATLGDLAPAASESEE